MNEKEKQQRTVIHLMLNDKHYYFGSLAAIYTRFTKDDIGISYGSLRNYGLSTENPYHNTKCTIYKGILTTIAKKS